MISIRAVSKTYAKGKKKAVDDVSFDIPNGAIFGFLGPNGAGKTTTIKMITGILNSDTGEITIGGDEIRKQPLNAKRKIGYVPDNPEIFSRLKGIEYLNFIADIYEISTETRKERIGEYTNLFGIADVLNAFIAGYSHGMKQKLILCGSLLHDPEYWILDEPMVGLDPQSAFSMKEIMRKRADSGKSVFFSTHVMEVAEKVCDRIGIINGGKIIFTGTLAELRARLKNEQSLENLFLELIQQ